MARALDQIIAELNNVYDPQRQNIRQQQEAIDPALQAEQQGLDYAKKDAFDQISNQANRRGMFYSGMPVAEEQRYTGGTYLPAVANLRGKYQQQRMNLADQLNNINLEQRKYGQDIYGQELAVDEQMRREAEQRRQFDASLSAQERASRAASAGMASPSFGFGGRDSLAYGMAKKPGSNGFSFVDPNGRPVSAATYAAATGIPFRTLLQQMASQGDVGARQALRFVGNDYGYDPSKINQGSAVYSKGNSNKAIYDALTWGR